MKIDLEKIENAKGYLYVNDKRCPEPICVDDYIAYKEIEKELGIDLATFIKVVFATDQECFVKSADEIERAEIVGFSKDDSNKCYVDLRIYSNTVDEDGNPTRYWFRDYPLKDYGKTWALTKEELL